MSADKLTAEEYSDFIQGVDHDDNEAWERFKLALERITGIPQPPKPLPEGWRSVGKAGW